ncbi:MAG: hypothetical protein OXJ90_29675 [Spirochaetaceae bacterium]|nr:hypothetical protein [Spirochaetaceae bacterium]
MTGGRGDLKLPLPLFNPMGKGHVAAMLDRLIGARAEDTAREALARVADRLSEDALGGAARVALVVADDSGGGWTDRFLSDEQVRFQGRALRKRGWAVAVLWTGDPPHAHAPERIEAATVEAVYRLAYQRRHGEPRLLRDRLLQEGLAARFGGTPEHRLADSATALTAKVVGRHLDADRFDTCFACLYGDDGARRAGYDPLGLPPWAGFGFGAEAVTSAGCDPLHALSTGPATAVPLLRGQPEDTD